MTATEQAYDGPPAATAVAFDMVRRALWVLPIALMLGAFAAGAAGLASVLYGVAIVLVNFVLSALLLSWASRISFSLVAAAALGGYTVRLGLVFLAVWLVRDASWVRFVPLGITIIATHLGLLLWELRYVSASFAHPGLKPHTGRPRSAAGSR
ncbi:MAG: ATP synthase subunit I [Acidimicrobiales bacterium]